VRQLEEQIEALQDDMRRLDIQAEWSSRTAPRWINWLTHRDIAWPWRPAGTVERQLALFGGLRQSES
jgi:hypothetical protein